MRRARTFTNAALVLTVGCCPPALAQEPPRADRDRSVFSGDYLILGVGAVSVPSYEGADTSNVLPAAGAIGRVGGIGFHIHGPSLSVNVIPEPRHTRVSFHFGPSLRYRANRHRNIKDDVVASLGTLKPVIEGGFGAGVTVRHVMSHHDRLSLGVGASWDVSGHGGGFLLSTSVNYLLPASRAQVFGMQFVTHIVDDRYAEYNYSVTPQGSAASGLPAYKATGGFKAASFGAFTARDLDGNFLDGGFAIGVGAIYRRLYGSAAETPITALRGSRDQWTLVAGLAYTF